MILLFDFVLFLFILRHNPGPLQCRGWKNRHLLSRVQALARLHQPRGQGARRLPHRARVEEAEVLDGPEERAVCLHRQVPQVLPSAKILFKDFLVIFVFQFHRQNRGGRLL